MVSWNLKAVQAVRELRPNLMGLEIKGALCFLTPPLQAFQCYFFMPISVKHLPFHCTKWHMDRFFRVDEPVRSRRLLIFSVLSPFLPKIRMIPTIPSVTKGFAIFIEQPCLYARHLQLGLNLYLPYLNWPQPLAAIVSVCKWRMKPGGGWLLFPK